MWNYYINNIFLLFLPSHSSHLLQPLDLSVFSLMKTAYWKEIDFQVGLTQSTVTEKRKFLAYYHKARLDSLTGKNIKSGWRAGGLWPVNQAKPLISRNLLDSEGHNHRTDANSMAEVNEGYPDTSNQAKTASGVVWQTPRKVSELQVQIRKFSA